MNNTLAAVLAMLLVGGGRWAIVYIVFALVSGEASFSGWVLYQKLAYVLIVMVDLQKILTTLMSD